MSEQQVEFCHFSALALPGAKVAAISRAKMGEGRCAVSSSVCQYLAAEGNDNAHNVDCCSSSSRSNHSSTTKNVERNSEKKAAGRREQMTTTRL